MNEGFLTIAGILLGFMFIMLVIGHVQEWRDSKRDDQ